MARCSGGRRRGWRGGRWSQFFQQLSEKRRTKPQFVESMWLKRVSFFLKGGKCYTYVTGKSKRERETEEVGRKKEWDSDGASLALCLEELFHVGSDCSCWQVCGCGHIWKKQDKIVNFFFLPQSHPYNQYFLNIYSVLDTVFLAGDKEMENTPQPEGQTDIDGQACGMLGESCLCLEWGGVRTPSPGDWRPPWSEVSKDEKEFSRRTTWGEACTWPLFKHTFVNHKYLLSACTC